MGKNVLSTKKERYFTLIFENGAFFEETWQKVFFLLNCKQLQFKRKKEPNTKDVLFDFWIQTETKISHSFDHAGVVKYKSLFINPTYLPFQEGFRDYGSLFSSPEDSADFFKKEAQLDKFYLLF